MICCLPSIPGYASVRRIDWMISLSFRSTWRFGSWTSSGSRRRWRTSCWVIVEAPRLLPRRLSIPAAMIATGSKPALSQNVLSSTATWASTTIGGMSFERDDLALLAAEPGELDPVAVEDHRLLAELQVLEELRRRREVLGVAREGGDDPDGPEDREDRRTSPRSTRAIQPAADGEVRRGGSRLGARSGRGASYTGDSGRKIVRRSMPSPGGSGAGAPVRTVLRRRDNHRCGVPVVERGAEPRLHGRVGGAAGEPVEADQRGPDDRRRGRGDGSARPGSAAAIARREPLVERARRRSGTRCRRGRPPDRAGRGAARRARATAIVDELVGQPVDDRAGDRVAGRSRSRRRSGRARRPGASSRRPGSRRT